MVHIVHSEQTNTTYVILNELEFDLVIVETF